MSKILVIEIDGVEQERITNHLARYLGEKLQVFFAQTVEEAKGLLQHREGWTIIVFGNCREKIGVLVQFVRLLIQKFGFDRQALIVLSHDVTCRVELVFAGCHKEVFDEIHLGDVLGSFLFNIRPPFRSRRRKTTI